MGARFLTAFAAAAARAGDLLLMALEPELLVSPGDGSDLAAQMGFALGHPEWIDASNITGEPVHWVADLVSQRPGAYHVFTLLGKLALGRPLYRYAKEDFSPAGWQSTAERRSFGEPKRWDAPIAPRTAALLLGLRDWADRHGVRLASLLPWQYVGPEKAPAWQGDNLRFLIRMSDFMPVLADEHLGAYGVREHFADTPLHLTPEGARIRTDFLAGQLQSGRFWNRADLVARLPGFPPAASAAP